MWPVYQTSWWQCGTSCTMMTAQWATQFSMLIFSFVQSELIRKLYLQNVLPHFVAKTRESFATYHTYLSCQQTSPSEYVCRKFPLQCHFKYITCRGLLSAFLWLCNHRYIIYSSVQEVCVYIHACTYIRMRPVYIRMYIIYCTCKCLVCKYIYTYYSPWHTTYVPAVYSSFYSNLWFLLPLFYALWMQRWHVPVITTSCTPIPRASLHVTWI